MLQTIQFSLFLTTKQKQKQKLDLQFDWITEGIIITAVLLLG